MARSGAGNRANYGSRSVTTSASVLMSANPSRQSATIQNVTRRTYVGTTSSVVAGSAGTASSGIKLTTGQSFKFEDYIGDIYGIADAASTDVRYLEIYG